MSCLLPGDWPSPISCKVVLHSSAHNPLAGGARLVHRGCTCALLTGQGMRFAVADHPTRKVIGSTRLRTRPRRPARAIKKRGNGLAGVSPSPLKSREICTFQPLQWPRFRFRQTPPKPAGSGHFGQQGGQHFSCRPCPWLGLGLAEQPGWARQGERPTPQQARPAWHGCSGPS
jgi:hypothetical protein